MAATTKATMTIEQLNGNTEVTHHSTFVFNIGDSYGSCKRRSIAIISENFNAAVESIRCYIQRWTGSHDNYLIDTVGLEFSEADGTAYRASVTFSC